ELRGRRSGRRGALPGLGGRLARRLRPVDVAPVAVVVLLPAPVLLPVDVAVAARVDVAAARPHDAGAPGSDWVPGDGGAACVRPRLPRGRARGAVVVTVRLGPLVAALPRRAPPAPVDVRALAGLPVGSGARVVGFAVAARAVRSPGGGAARVRAGARVIARGDPRSAVRAVGDGGASVGAGPRVVGRAVAVRRVAGIVIGIHPAIAP